MKASRGPCPCMTGNPLHECFQASQHGISKVKVPAKCYYPVTLLVRHIILSFGETPHSLLIDNRHSSPVIVHSCNSSGLQSGQVQVNLQANNNILYSDWIPFNPIQSNPIQFNSILFQPPCSYHFVSKIAPSDRCHRDRPNTHSTGWTQPCHGSRH